MSVDKGEDNTEREAVELKIADESDKARKRRVREAWEITLSTPQGRAVVWDIILSTNMYEHPPSADLARFTGGADIGRALYETIRQAYPRRFIEMLQENM